MMFFLTVNAIFMKVPVKMNYECGQFVTDEQFESSNAC